MQNPNTASDLTLKQRHFLSLAATDERAATETALRNGELFGVGSRGDDDLYAVGVTGLVDPADGDPAFIDIPLAPNLYRSHPQAMDAMAQDQRIFAESVAAGEYPLGTLYDQRIFKVVWGKDDTLSFYDTDTGDLLAVQSVEDTVGEIRAA